MSRALREIRGIFSLILSEEYGFVIAELKRWIHQFKLLYGKDNRHRIILSIFDFVESDSIREMNH